MSGRQSSLADTLVDIISATVELDQIILFGSRTTSSARPGSDYDFLVVVPHVDNERQESRPRMFERA